MKAHEQVTLSMLEAQEQNVRSEMCKSEQFEIDAIKARERIWMSEMRQAEQHYENTAKAQENMINSELEELRRSEQHEVERLKAQEQSRTDMLRLQLEKQVVEMRMNHFEEVQSLQQQNDRLQSHSGKLEGDMKEVHTQHSEMVAARTQLCGENTKLMSERDGLQAKIDEMEKLCNSWKQEWLIRNRFEINKQRDREQRELEHLRACLREENSELLIERDTLQDKVDSLSEALSSQEKQTEMSRMQRYELQEELKSLAEARETQNVQRQLEFEQLRNCLEEENAKLKMESSCTTQAQKELSEHLTAVRLQMDSDMFEMRASEQELSKQVECECDEVQRQKERQAKVRQEHHALLIDNARLKDRLESEIEMRKYEQGLLASLQLQDQKPNDAEHGGKGTFSSITDRPQLLQQMAATTTRQERPPSPSGGRPRSKTRKNVQS
eukprot:gnl/TRDRNA2_/TRDRNA2_174492_c2_seq4.p1 gnl/TRDRNA2_/TRDRNA2_174492_c2~~gnl/TRDRNA2_/TRDRNA2_174492_c2_seq4.p1  ORF type:complete len:457 (+),score=112.97 gnl/TRDRNA2_/TRDRNA2_174492_c2_seq4:54-1373(+)